MTISSLGLSLRIVSLIIPLIEVWMRAIWEVDFSQVDLFEQICFRVTLEGLNAEHESVKNNTGRPIISCWAHIPSIIANLRRHESWSAAECP